MNKNTEAERMTGAGQIDLTKPSATTYDFIPKEDITFLDVIELLKVMKMSLWNQEPPKSIARHFVKRED